MRLLLAITYLTVCFSQFVNANDPPIVPVPAPWTLKASVYAIPILPIAPLPAKAYSPLERNSTATEGKFAGILGVIMVIRYYDTPVGPYDEFLIVPGYFKYPKKKADGTTVTQTNVRGTRFYVSQKYTNWNGRVNWNIPKHLAKFVWTDGADGSTSVKVYPYDTEGSPNDAGPSAKPFFQFKFSPLLPTGLPIPIDTDLFKYLGITPFLLGQAPLPEGNGSFGELPGTTQWAETALGVATKDITPGSVDLYQYGGDDTGNGFNLVGDEYFSNFWPGLTRYNIGVKLLNSTISFPVPERWTA